MNVSRILTRGRTTIPKGIREALMLAAGDTLTFEIRGDCVVVRKRGKGPAEGTGSPLGFLDEWLSPEDEEAWRSL